MLHQEKSLPKWQRKPAQRFAAKTARVIALAAAGFLAFAAASSLAVAQDAKHCDRLTDDDAFNKCLAAASPSRAGERPATMPATSATESPVAVQPRTRASRSYRGGSRYGYTRRSYTRSYSRSPRRAYSGQWQVQRRSSGRMRMVIPMSGRRR
jgi:hypothetical protein